MSIIEQGRIGSHPPVHILTGAVDLRGDLTFDGPADRTCRAGGLLSSAIDMQPEGFYLPCSSCAP